jgi:hypothetical protein
VTRPLLQPFLAAPEHADGVLWLATRAEDHRSLAERAASDSTLALQIVMLLGLALLLWSARPLLGLARRVQPADWRQLALWTAAGAALRSIGGVRIPGYTNAAGYAHGFGLLNDALVWNPLGMDPHGNGWHALHGLALWVLPRRELSIAGLQLALSVATIPLVYVVARWWLKDRSWALGSSAVMALLPTQVYFASTEVRLVPGTFFMLLALATLGAAMRSERRSLWFAAALFAAASAHCYPTLLVLPVVAVLFVSAQPDARRLVKKAAAWVAALGFLLLWVGPAAWAVWLVTTQRDSVIGSGFLRTFRKADALVLPAFELDGREIYSAFLNAELTPPTFWLLAVLGVGVGLRLAGRRFAVASILGCALLLTLVGLFPGRLNLARLQLAAGPFYAMLAGAGLSVLSARVARLVRRPFALPRLLTAAVVLAGSVALWPGPIGQRYTLQHERQLFLDGLTALRDGCTVIWAPGSHGAALGMPTYLAEERGRKLHWGALERDASAPRDLVAREPCVIYYRSSLCFTLFEQEIRDEPLRPECARIEAELDLREVFVRSVPANPDDMVEYAAPAMPLGFFEVVGAR